MQNKQGEKPQTTVLLEKPLKIPFYLLLYLSLCSFLLQPIIYPLVQWFSTTVLVRDCVNSGKLIDVT